jgi:hypothetical protein
VERVPRRDRLGELADALELDVDRIGICQACLSVVSLPLDHGDEREAKRSAREMTPLLWEEGLAEPALVAVRRAGMAGVPGADAALADLQRDGGRSAAARAIVLRLAADQAVRRAAFRRWFEASRPDRN